MTKKLYFITGNQGKYIEAKEKLRPIGYDVIQKNIGYPELQADTLEEVAQHGAAHVQQRIDHPFMLEDAGVFIESLHDFPGLYSKYVFFTIGLTGILKLLSHEQNRNAVFRSVYAYAKQDGPIHLFVGETQGTIITELRGSHGFGYDPIFIPKGEDKTFAEMNTTTKNKRSHRGKALDKLALFLTDK